MRLGFGGERDRERERGKKKKKKKKKKIFLGIGVLKKGRGVFFFLCGGGEGYVWLGGRWGVHG